MGTPPPDDSKTKYVEAFTNAGEIVARRTNDRLQDKVISRISVVRGNQHHQLVDLVLAGGGMLGLAQVGFLYVLEKCGLRFRCIAGASAGSINAMLLAVKRQDPFEEGSLKLLQLLADSAQSRDFSTFKDNADPDQKARADALYSAVISLLDSADKAAPSPQQQSPVNDRWWKKVGSWCTFGWNGIKWAALLKQHWAALQEFWTRRSLYEGDVFEKWMTQALDSSVTEGGKLDLEKLDAITKLPDDVTLVPTPGRSQKQIQSYAADFVDKMKATHTSDQCEENGSSSALQPSEKRLVQDLMQHLKHQPLNQRIALVASDVTHQTRAVFPKDWKNYWAAPPHPAEFVRASMSIPGFFKPKLAKDMNTEFVDGGTLSNFPLELVYDLQYPSLVTTIGVQMGGVPKQTFTDTLPKLLMAVFDNSRRILDRLFIQKRHGHPGIATVDTAGFDWLKFEADLPEQVSLFTRGAEAAEDLLTRFNIFEYMSAMEPSEGEVQNTRPYPLISPAGMAKGHGLFNPSDPQSSTWEENGPGISLDQDLNIRGPNERADGLQGLTLNGDLSSNTRSLGADFSNFISGSESFFRNARAVNAESFFWNVRAANQRLAAPPSGKPDSHEHC